MYRVKHWPKNKLFYHLTHSWFLNINHAVHPYRRTWQQCIWDLYDCKKKKKSVSSWHQPCLRVPNPLRFLFFGCQTPSVTSSDVWTLSWRQCCPALWCSAAGNLAGTGLISPRLSSVVLHVWIVNPTYAFCHLSMVFVFGCQNCPLHFHFKLLFSQYVVESSVSLPPF